MKKIKLIYSLLAAGVLAYLLLFPIRLEEYEGLLRWYHDLPPPEARILFVGDMMFDRAIRTAMETHGPDWPLSCVKEELLKYDFVVGNLEGPITKNQSVSQGSIPETPENYTFTFPIETAQVLQRNNILLVNLGNNHTMNFSLSGLLETKNYLDSAGISHFGDPDLPEHERVWRGEVHEIPFSFVNWSDWTSDKTDHTVAEVRKEAGEGRVVVVYTHWGEEYVEPSARMKALAHQFVDAGAAIVIGSHPHVVLEREVYNGKSIYYSLGNFIFDQYWEEAVSHGQIVAVTFGKEGVVEEKTFTTEALRDGRTCLE